MSGLGNRLDLYPVGIVQDRYNGTYSKGPWLAVASFIEQRLSEMDEGPCGDDVEAMHFWHDPPAWIAVGDTPNDALAALLAKNPAPPERP